MTITEEPEKLVEAGVEEITTLQKNDEEKLGIILEQDEFSEKTVEKDQDEKTNEQDQVEETGENDQGEETGKKDHGDELGEIEEEHLEDEKENPEIADSEIIPEEVGEEEGNEKKDIEEEEKAEAENAEEENTEEEKAEEEQVEEPEEIHEEEKPETPPIEEILEEEAVVEEGPPDPAAPYDFSDSKEALKAPFELRQDQLAELEQLWDLFQNYTPVYAELDGFITEKELVFMLKSLLLMTFTPEQLQELIAYCVRPPAPHGRITYEQFVKMVTIRKRDFPIEEELRLALEVFDPDKTGLLDRENFRDAIAGHGNKMSGRLVDKLIKEVDITNDGLLGVEDVLGTMCIDLNIDDLQLLIGSINPNTQSEDD